jgi:hypothetical protein
VALQDMATQGTGVAKEEDGYRNDVVKQEEGYGSARGWILLGKRKGVAKQEDRYG